MNTKTEAKELIEILLEDFDLLPTPQQEVNTRIINLITFLHGKALQIHASHDEKCDRIDNLENQLDYLYRSKCCH